MWRIHRKSAGHLLQSIGFVFYIDSVDVTWVADWLWCGVGIVLRDQAKLLESLKC